jgi:hypothetical protein
MKKSTANLKYAPPTLSYQTSLKTTVPVVTGIGSKVISTMQGSQNSNGNLQTPPSTVQQNYLNKIKNDNKIVTSASNQSLHANNSSGAIRMGSKHKTEQKINY